MTEAIMYRILSAGKETVQYGRFNFIITTERPQAWVIVMGLTGAGKSSFIRDIAGGDHQTSTRYTMA